MPCNVLFSVSRVCGSEPPLHIQGRKVGTIGRKITLGEHNSFDLRLEERNPCDRGGLQVGGRRPFPPNSICLRLSGFEFHILGPVGKTDSLSAEADGESLRT